MMIYLISLEDDIINEICKYLEPNKFYYLYSSNKTIKGIINKNQYILYNSINEYYSLQKATCMGWKDYIIYNLEKYDYGMVTKENILKYSIICKHQSIFDYIFHSIYQHNKSNIETNLYELMNLGILYYNLYVIDYLHNLYIKQENYDWNQLYDGDSFIYSIDSNNSSLLTLLINNNIIIENAVEYAVLYSNLEILKLLLNKGFEVTLNSLSMVAEKQSLEMFELLEEYNDEDLDPGDLLTNAILHDSSIEIIEFIILHYDFSTEVAKNENILQDIIIDDKRLIKLLYNHGFEFDTNILNLQCKFGNYENVVELIELGIPTNKFTLRRTVKSNNINIMKYLMELDDPIINNEILYSMYLATRYNRPEMIEYIHMKLKQINYINIT